MAENAIKQMWRKKQVQSRVWVEPLNIVERQQ